MRALRGAAVGDDAVDGDRIAYSVVLEDLDVVSAVVVEGKWATSDVVPKDPDVASVVSIVPVDEDACMCSSDFQRVGLNAATVEYNFCFFELIFFCPVTVAAWFCVGMKEDSCRATEDVSEREGDGETEGDECEMECGGPHMYDTDIFFAFEDVGSLASFSGRRLELKSITFRARAELLSSSSKNSGFCL